MPKKLTDAQYRLVVMVAAQADYGVRNGDWDCLDAAGHNATILLKKLGVKTAAEEQEEEDERDRLLDMEGDDDE